MGEPLAITGYACLFGVPDLGRDVVIRGAFAETLARASRPWRMLLDHDPHNCVGMWTEIREDDMGLFVRGHIAPVHRGVIRLVISGELGGLSIGFKAVKARTDLRDCVRWLSRIDLWEISLTATPMQVGARITVPRDQLMGVANAE